MRFEFYFKLYLTVALLIVWSASTYAVTVVNFDDLTGPIGLTETNYAGLTWEEGNIGRGIYPGVWAINGEGSSYWPHSGAYNVVNGFGATLMGIGFPTQVDVFGAYFGGQGMMVGWTTGIRVHGYRDDYLVATTAWFNDIDDHPDWFAMNLVSIDRLVVECVPVLEGGGYYTMDDLTFSVPEPTSLLFLGTSCFWWRIFKKT